MAYGTQVLSQGDSGPAVVELQMRLAGFRGTLPDGDYGGGTQLQVTTFQRDVMGMPTPSGVADLATLAAIDAFAAQHPLDFKQFKCVCGKCGGFGQGLYKGLYYKNSKDEAYNRYEYPGIHRMLLWAYRGAIFYAAKKNWKLRINSGYRCSIDNAQNKRTSTNHHGKAIDIDILGPKSVEDDRHRCNLLRGLLVEKANAQIGWGAANRKALEPETIAPTWVHYDVRSYASRYLDPVYFVRDLATLDAPPPGV